MLVQMHLHRFELKSDFSGIHFHYIKGYVKSNIGMGKMHVHVYSGVTPAEDHSHNFSGITGPPVKTENGHIHKISGILQRSAGHIHN
ncbi:MAG: YmaF family protein, partial [Eubacteriales bacterium]|nr:YmaF family protein [Eubacteriales bacterium]